MLRNYLVGKKWFIRFKTTNLYKMLRKVYFSIVINIERKKVFFKQSGEMEKNHYIVRFTNPKVSFYLPYYAEDLIQVSIASKRNYYENAYLNYVCKQWRDGCIGMVLRNRAILDIGANIGNHTLYYLLECRAAFAYVFEPIEDTFAIMRKNMEINALLDKVKLYNVGVGEKNSSAAIKNYNRKNTGGGCLCLDSEGNIPIIAIDELEIDKEIALIKVDTEGFEIGVVKGMIHTIQKYHPYLMIEIQPENYREINKILYNIGYLHEQHSECNYFYYYNGK